MMDTNTMREISAKAVRKNAMDRKVPLIAERDDIMNMYLLWEHLRHMPFVGEYEPRGYTKVSEYFVDSTCFKRPDEPSLARDQFLNNVKVGHSYAITDMGDSQMCIGEFKLTGFRAVSFDGKIRLGVPLEWMKEE
jgi:hypothetical protein